MPKVTRCLFTLIIMILVMGFPGITNVFARNTVEPVMKPVADEIIGSNGITWVPNMNYARLELTVSRPDGTVFQKTFDSGSSPYLDLSSIFGESNMDGSYTYELRVTPSTGQLIRGKSEAAPRSRGLQSHKALTQTGYFTVREGMIITPGAIEPANVRSTARDGLSGAQDQLILDDLIVTGSLCVGFDCINGESFGFDTIRLKENNLRIRFYDTSSSAGFPSNDWQITANDSASGGANRFSIDDIDSGKTPFTIEAGTRANALYVDDSGRVGLGTSTPAEDLHIWHGDTPTIRLAQSGGGWSPQTWDIAGNEANFFIRDVTNGSELPFRIKPGAPENSIFINSNGNIGFGTQSPGYPLHLVTNSSTNAEFVVGRTGGATNFISAAAGYGFFGTTTNHPLRINVNGSWRMQLNADNSLTMASGATCTAGGVWTSTSSRKAKENIRNLTADEAIEALDGLNPVTFNYKAEKEETYVGFIAEDVPELVASKDRKHLTPMDVVAVLTKVVQEQQKLAQEQQKTIAELKKEIAELKKK